MWRGMKRCSEMLGGFGGNGGRRVRILIKGFLVAVVVSVAGM